METSLLSGVGASERGWQQQTRPDQHRWSSANLTFFFEQQAKKKKTSPLFNAFLQSSIHHRITSNSVREALVEVIIYYGFTGSIFLSRNINFFSFVCAVRKVVRRKFDRKVCENVYKVPLHVDCDNVD